MPAEARKAAFDPWREAVGVAYQADGVEVAAQQQPAAPTVAPASQDDAGPAGGSLERFHAQAGAEACRAIGARQFSGLFGQPEKQ